MLMAAEKLYKVPGFEGYYVDSSGDVYSRWINKARHGLVLGEKYRKLKPRVSKKGHLSVQLGRGNQILVHRLIYSTIVGEIPKGMVVRHLNDIPSDNRIENLAIGTQKDNALDCIRNGNHRPNIKIPEKCYGDIVKLKETHTWKEIAEIYQVNEKTVRNHINVYMKRGLMQT